jgi:hypothetical protein
MDGTKKIRRAAEVFPADLPQQGVVGCFFLRQHGAARRQKTKPRTNAFMPVILHKLLIGGGEKEDTAKFNKLLLPWLSNNSFFAINLVFEF